jgi:hypothetical protein
MTVVGSVSSSVGGASVPSIFKLPKVIKYRSEFKGKTYKFSRQISHFLTCIAHSSAGDHLKHEESNGPGVKVWFDPHHCIDGSFGWLLLLEGLGWKTRWISVELPVSEKF